MKKPDTTDAHPAPAATKRRRPRRAASVPAAPRKATPGSWRPGQSGNPTGRRPNALALAERIREKVDPGELIDIALALAREGQAESTRMAALAWLSDRGWSKPATQSEHKVLSVSTTLPLRWADMTPEQRGAYLDARLHPGNAVLDVEPKENDE